MKKELKSEKTIKSTKSKGGAPKKEEEEKKKFRFVAFFNLDGKNRIQKKMSKWGYKNFSTLCHDLLINRQIKVEFTPIFNKETETMFNKIGVNMNQIARNLNSNVLMDPDYLRQMLQEIRADQERIIKNIKELVRP